MTFTKSYLWLFLDDGICGKFYMSSLHISELFKCFMAVLHHLHKDSLYSLLREREKCITQNYEHANDFQSDPS